MTPHQLSLAFDEIEQHNTLTEKQLERFWAKVDKTTRFGPNGDCWEWIGSKTTAGYGNLTIDHKSYYAHRIAVFIARGIDPHKGHGCHECDTPSCVNPEHIIIADQKFNMSGCLERGRMKHALVRGVFHHKSKLTDNIVNEIKEERRNGVTQIQLAQKWEVSVSTIKDIEHGRTWRNPSANEVRVSTAKR